MAWSDVQYAVRALVREPKFSSICVLMLAIGIGGNTAIFSVVDAVLLKPLPYREPERLVSLREVIPAVAATYPTLPVSANHFTQWRQRCSSFHSLSAIITGTLNMTGIGEPERLDVARVSANTFETLGIYPALGRSFAAAEESAGQDRVVILADSLWRRSFRADPQVIGRSVMLDGAAHTIVGVLPPSFRFPDTRFLDTGARPADRPEIFKPVAFSQGELKELMGTFNYSVVARLEMGVTRAAALAELNVIAAQLEKIAGEQVNLQAAVTPLHESLVRGSRRGLLMLLGAVGSVLLIVCVNLANLLLARAEQHSREWGIRSALGAGRGRLMRQVLAETMLISLLGGTVGILLANAILGGLLSHVPADIPMLQEVQLDGRVLVFALALTLLTGLLFGIAPAWRSTRTDPQGVLRSGGRTATAGKQSALFRNCLVSAEVALSMVLLVLAALLGTSFVHVLRADKGFTAPSVLAADIAMPLARYSTGEQRNRFHDQVLEKLAAQPGVASAALCTALPLTGETWIDAAWAPGDPRPQVERPTVNVRFVSVDYLKTMGIPLLGGRTFDEGDRNRKVSLISERLARQLWPGQDAVGRKYERGGGERFEVIGVTGDVRADPDKPSVAMIYRPYWDWAPRRVMVVARANADPRSISGAIRSAVHGVDPDVPIPEMQTMRAILDQSVSTRRFQSVLCGVFGATAVLLAALGIYGVVSYSVARRTNEMGVRMALGARPRDLRVMVVRQAMLPVIAGLGIGAAGAAIAGRLVAALLYDINARDPLTIAAVAALLALVAMAASWAPAHRASAVDPLQSLRCE